MWRLQARNYTCLQCSSLCFQYLKCSSDRLAESGSSIFPCSPVETMIAFSSHRPRYLAAQVPLFVSFAFFFFFFFFFKFQQEIRSSIPHINNLLLHQSSVTISVCNTYILYYKVITQQIGCISFQQLDLLKFKHLHTRTSS